jgi:hypothetical protein
LTGGKYAVGYAADSLGRQREKRDSGRVPRQFDTTRGNNSRRRKTLSTLRDLPHTQIRQHVAELWNARRSARVVQGAWIYTDELVLGCKPPKVRGISDINQYFNVIVDEGNGVAGLRLSVFQALMLKGRVTLQKRFVQSIPQLSERSRRCSRIQCRWIRRGKSDLLVKISDRLRETV